MLTTYGVAEVAKWCGVRSSAVTNWRERYGDWPIQPAVRIRSGSMTYYGWLFEQRESWLAWYYGEAKEIPSASKGTNGVLDSPQT